MFINSFTIQFSSITGVQLKIQSFIQNRTKQQTRNHLFFIIVLESIIKS